MTGDAVPEVFRVTMHAMDQNEGERDDATRVFLNVYINFDLHYNSGALDLTGKLNLVLPIELKLVYQRIRSNNSHVISPFKEQPLNSERTSDQCCSLRSCPLFLCHGQRDCSSSPCLSLRANNQCGPWAISLRPTEFAGPL